MGPASRTDGEAERLYGGSLRHLLSSRPALPLMRGGRRLLTVVIWLLVVAPAAAQSPSPGSNRLRLAIDCQGVSCDFEFLRTQITFVDHVRDRQTADVHVLVTSQNTAAGGRELTFSFFGQGTHQGQDHAVRQAVPVASSADVIRREMVRLISLGLIAYAIRASTIDDLAVTVQRRPWPTAQQSDPWNRWTFRSQVNGNGSGERSTKLATLSASATANRTTETVKFAASITAGYSESSFELPDGQRYVAPNRNLGSSATLVQSLGGNWSAGVRGSVSSTTFRNLDRAWYIAPAIEYDVFPYSESTRRILTFQYSTGVRSFDYKAETLFGKLNETRAAQKAIAALTARQRWGTVSAGIEATSFVPDVKYNNVTGWGDIDLSLYKGLSLNFSAELSAVHDQLYLPKGRATTEEILVRQRQLATGYQYFYSVGVSYTFGSIFSAIVNPRMERGAF
jgi:hypothetical protein